MKFVAVLTAAVLAGSALAGCGKHAHNYNLECDVPGDYAEHDSDCGYVDNSGQWQYFSWTSPNKTTYSPDGWEPPAGVVIEQDDDHGKHKKPTKKPKITASPTRKK